MIRRGNLLDILIEYQVLLAPSRCVGTPPIKSAPSSSGLGLLAFIQAIEGSTPSGVTKYEQKDNFSFGVETEKNDYGFVGGEL